MKTLIQQIRAELDMTPTNLLKTQPLKERVTQVVADYDKAIASIIDHTILLPEATYEKVVTVCEEAVRYKFCTVCVNSSHIELVSTLLEGSGVLPIAVIGFPLGMCTTSSKVFETKESIRLGAKEIDMVVNISALKSKDYLYVKNDIAAVVEAAGKIPVKVILETSKLTKEEKVAACLISKDAHAAFVKTSTGFGGGGATPEDIALMREAVGSELKVKASGAVRTKADAQAVIAAGADRIGASASIAIVTGATSSSSY